MAMSWTHTIQWYLKIFTAQVIIITITSAASTVPPPIPSTTTTEEPTTTIKSTNTAEITTVNVANQDDDSDEVAGLRAGLIVMTIIAIIAIGIIVVGVVLKLRKRRRRQQKQTDMYDIVTGVAPSNPGDPNYSKPAVYGKEKKIATTVSKVDETPSEPTQDYENTNPDGNAPRMNSNGHPQLTSQVSVEGAVYEDFTNSSSQKSNHQQPDNAPTVSAPAPPKQNKKNEPAESTEIKDRSIPDVPDAGSEAPGEMIYQNEDADSENPQLNAVYSALDMENSPTYDHTYMSMQKSD